MKRFAFLVICALFALYFVLIPSTGGLGIVDAKELPGLSSVGELVGNGWKAIISPQWDTSVGWASVEGATPAATMTPTATVEPTAAPATATPVPSSSPTPTVTPTPPPLVTIEENFKGEFRGGVGSDVGESWTSYVLDGPPTYDGEKNTRIGGGLAQKISGHAAFRAGVYRQVGTTAGTPYTVTINCQLYPLAEGTIRFGLDPYGGTDATSTNIVWQETTELGKWVGMVQTGTAGANAITIFLEVHNPTGFNTNAYFDELTIEVHPPV